MQYDSVDTYCNSHDNEDDLIFDVTPFIAHLVDNVECSFFTEGSCVTLAELSLEDLHEVLHRLSQCGVVPSSVDCVYGAGGCCTYGLGLSREALGHGYNSDCSDSGDSSGDREEDTLSSLRLLKQMIKVFCNNHSDSGNTDTGCSLSLRLLPTELHITNVTLDSMDTVAKTLKSICVKPKKVFSDSNSLYSFELLRDDISVHLQQSEVSEGGDGGEEEDIFAGILNCNDYFTCLRSLRHNLAASQFSKQQNNNNENNQNDNIQSSFISSGGSGRGRGRPRKLINNNSQAIEGEPKRKRGRPRLSDLHSLITSIKSEVTQESSKHSEKSAEQDSPAV